MQLIDEDWRHDGGLRLYSITDLHGMFPTDAQKDVKITELGRLVEQFGTYRKIGKAVLLTRADIRSFFRHVAAMKPAGPIEPSDSEPGLIVCIGDRAGSNAGQSVFIDWCPVGDELGMLRDVNEYADESAQLIGFKDVSYGEFVKWRAEMRKPAKDPNWSHGKWFFRTNKVMKVFQTSDELEGV